MEVINNVLKPSLVQRHFFTPLQNFTLTNLMLQKQSMENKKTRYHNYNLQNEINVKNSKLYKMWSKNKWEHLRWI